MKIKNMTPHSITLCGEEYPSEGVVRVASSEKPTNEIIVGKKSLIPVLKQEFGDVEGLPPADEDTVLIVSSLVLSQVGDRGKAGGDCFAPTKFVRDEAGKIVGAEALYQL